jgi:hypothetical protein
VARIDWGAGSVTNTLGSPRPDPANRFFDVNVDYKHIGPIKVALTRAIHAFTFREDYTVSVTIKHLSPSVSDDALELKQWLMTGGDVTLVTDDVDGNAYTGLTLAPGTEPVFKLDDEERQHYSFTCVLTDDSAITVNYDG